MCANLLNAAPMHKVSYGRIFNTREWVFTYLISLKGGGGEEVLYLMSKESDLPSVP